MNTSMRLFKSSKSLLVMTLLTSVSVFSGSVLAADNGVIRFHGAVQDVACSISGSDGLNQTINMETSSVKQLTGGGEGPRKDFKISLEACDITTHKTVDVTFRGAVDQNNKNAFSDQSGSTKYIGLILRDADGNIINPTTGVASKTLVNGDQNMYFTANLIGTSASEAPAAGRFDTSVNVELTYK